MGLEAPIGVIAFAAAVLIAGLAIVLACRAKQSYAALAESQAMLAESQRIANMGSFRWNVRTNELVWSDQIYRMFGFDTTFRPTYEDYLAAIHPEDRAQLLRAIQAALTRRAPYQARHRIVRPDGEVRTLVARGEVVFSPAGDPLRMLGICQDVTENAQLQEAAEEGRRKLEQAQRIANVGSWEWEFESGELSWSAQCYRIAGWHPESGAPTLERFLTIVHKDDHEAVTQTISAARASGKACDFEHRMVWPCGTVRVVHQLGEVKRDASGRPVRMIGTTQDITEERAVRTELEESRFKAEAANRAKSQFVANMSHELRTPLNAIIGFSELLQSDEIELSDERRCEYARDINASGKHLLSVINDILDISRIEAGKVTLEEETVPLAGLIDAALRMVRPRADETGVALSSSVLADATVTCDQRLMLQALLNLTSNALKFTERGGRVDVSARRSKADGLEIVVRDTGIGMSAEDVARVGEPFLQVDGRLARKFEGTGLGLVISKRLIELHGAKLGIESELGGGTTMTIVLPASRVSYARGGIQAAAAS